MSAHRNSSKAKPDDPVLDWEDLQEEEVSVDMMA